MKTYLTYEVQGFNLHAVKEIVSSLERVGFECSVNESNPVKPVITMGIDKDMSLTDALYLGSMIGAIQTRMLI